MLSLPAPTRVALGTLQVGGQKVELFISPEWARYLQSLNAQVQSNAQALALNGALTALMADGADTPDVLPAPPGPRGAQGEPGLALFMLQDEVADQTSPVPPCVDGVYVPLNTKDASGGVSGLTQFKLNLKNAAGTVISWITSAATAARTWTMPDKDGTVAMVDDFAAPPAIGSAVPAAAAFTSVAATGGGSFDTVTAAAGFGCNGKAPQVAAASGGTLDGVIAALVANGILSS